MTERHSHLPWQCLVRSQSSYGRSCRSETSLQDSGTNLARMFRNHSAGWVSDRWPPFCRKLLAGLALIASGTLFVEFVEPFPGTWSSSWKQVGASVPVLTQDWDTNGSMKSFISHSIESIPRKMIIFLYLYILIVVHPFLGQKFVYLSCFIYLSRHSQVAVPIASSWMQPGALELGIKTWAAWVPKKQGISPWSKKAESTSG